MKAKTAIENGIISTLCRQCNMRCGVNIHIANGKVIEMPKAVITRPAVVFKPRENHTQIVPWDADQALSLWQKRQSETGTALPDVIDDPTHVTTAAQEKRVGRNRLVLKAKNSAEFMYYTTDNE